MKATLVRLVPAIWRRRMVRLLNKVGPIPFRIVEGPASGLIIRAPFSRGLGYRRGRTEANVLSIMPTILKPGMVACDVGSYLGYYTLAMAQLVEPTGRIYAFEALPRHVKTLSRTVRLNNLSHVNVVPAAVSSSTGEAMLDEWSNDSMNHVTFGESMPWCVRRLFVPMITLDDWAAGEELTRLDCIKLDVEGQELAVLEGASKIIARFRPAIVCEVHRALHVPYRPREIVEWLRQAAYSVEPIDSGAHAMDLAAALDRLEAVKPAPGIMYVLHILARPLESGVLGTRTVPTFFVPPRNGTRCHAR